MHSRAIKSFVKQEFNPRMKANHSWNVLEVLVLLKTEDDDPSQSTLSCS